MKLTRFRCASKASRMLSRQLLLLLLLLALSFLQAGVASLAIADSERDAEIMSVLDEYMDALNELDIERHVSTYHFPHYRHASGKITVWKNAREAMPLLDVPESERRARLVEVLGDGWHHSLWTRREIVQGDETKVHVVTRFVRYRLDGSEIASFDSLYVLTFEAGRWAVKGRSSFAP
jgi:hypothetical protein